MSDFQLRVWLICSIFFIVKCTERLKQMTTQKTNFSTQIFILFFIFYVRGDTAISRKGTNKLFRFVYCIVPREDQNRT